MSCRRRIELLKDVFTLIYPELMSRHNPLSSSDNADRKVKLKAWLQDITSAVLHQVSPWAKAEFDGSLKWSGNLLPQLMDQLREVVLSHQWLDVMNILDCLSQIPSGADWTTFRASLAAFYTEPDKNYNLIQDFFKNAYLLGECNVRDVVLEFAIYLLSQGKTCEASQAIQKVRKVRRGVSQAEQRPFTQYLIDLLDAYQGLIYYVDWKEQLHRKGILSENMNSPSQSYYSMTSSQGLSDSAIKSIADRALRGLDSLQDKPGIWDIFITKSVEIHNFYKNFDTSRKILQMYAERNPDNPNAHRFLFDLLHNNKDQFDETSAEEEMFFCLKSIVKLDPASPLALTLWQIFTDQGYPTEALCCIFDLLDHFSLKDSVEGWQSLVKTLTRGLSREAGAEDKQSFLGALGDCCQCRRDWWPSYHFAPRGIKQSRTLPATLSVTEESLLVAKCTAAAILMGKDCSFCQIARSAMSSDAIGSLGVALSSLDGDLLQCSHEKGLLLSSLTPQPLPKVSGVQGESSILSFNISCETKTASLDDDVSVASSAATTEWLKSKESQPRQRSADQGFESAVQDLDFDVPASEMLEKSNGLCEHSGHITNLLQKNLMAENITESRQLNQDTPSKDSSVQRFAKKRKRSDCTPPVIKTEKISEDSTCSPSSRADLPTKKYKKQKFSAVCFEQVKIPSENEPFSPPTSPMVEKKRKEIDFAVHIDQPGVFSQPSELEALSHEQFSDKYKISCSSEKLDEAEECARKKRKKSKKNKHSSSSFRQSEQLEEQASKTIQNQGDSIAEKDNKKKKKKKKSKKNKHSSLSFRQSEQFEEQLRQSLQNQGDSIAKKDDKKKKKTEDLFGTVNDFDPMALKRKSPHCPVDAEASLHLQGVQKQQKEELHFTYGKDVSSKDSSDNGVNLLDNKKQSQQKTNEVSDSDLDFSEIEQEKRAPHLSSSAKKSKIKEDLKVKPSSSTASSCSSVEKTDDRRTVLSKQSIADNDELSKSVQHSMDQSSEFIHIDDDSEKSSIFPVVNVKILSITDDDELSKSVQHSIDKSSEFIHSDDDSDKSSIFPVVNVKTLSSQDGDSGNGMDGIGMSGQDGDSGNGMDDTESSSRAGLTESSMASSRKVLFEDDDDDFFT